MAEQRANKTVKESFLNVYDKLGGDDALLKWASESASNKRIFYQMFGKMLPREVHVQNGDSPESLPFRVLIEGEKEDGSDAPTT